MAAVPPRSPAPQPPPHEPGIGEAQRRRVLIDLHHRAEGGIPVHLAAWLLVVGSSGLYHEHLPLASAIGALFLLIALARLVLRRRFQALVRRRYRLANRVFLTLLLSNGAIWGLLAGISLHWPVLMPAQRAWCPIS